MTFAFRLLKNLLSLFCIELPLQLLGAIVLIPLCAVYKIGQLPRAFRFFDSADPFVGRDTSVIDCINATPEKSPYFWKNGYITRYNWLAWRNPINYFSYKYLGYTFTGRESYDIIGSLDVGDSTGKHEGLKIINLSTGVYEYLYVKKVGDKACIYLRMGWKIVNMQNRPGSFCQKVFTVSYRSYSGT